MRYLSQEQPLRTLNQNDRLRQNLFFEICQELPGSPCPEQRDAELIFGLVYGVGTDSDEVVRVLVDYLKQFNYAPREFRISQYLRSLNLGIEFDDASPVNLMHALMDSA